MVSRLLLVLLLSHPGLAGDYTLFCQPPPRLVQIERGGRWERVEQRGGALVLEPGPVHLRLRRFGYRDLEWSGNLGREGRLPPGPGQVLRLEPVLVQLQLETSPAGALAELAGQPVGLTPGPFTVPLETWPNAQTPVTVRLSRPGYRDHEFSLPPGVERWPPEGSFPLPPRWPVVMPLYELARAHPLLSVLLLGLVLGLLGRARAERLRWKRLESLVVSREDDPWLGKHLGGYFLLEQLGRGGMATVYLALPPGATRREQARALKVLDRGALGDSQELHFRFLREVKILAKLRHPAIVGLEAYGEHEGLLYVVMDWIQGPSLASRVRPGGLLLAEAMEVLRPLLQGVGYAHQQGIVHRDLKPDNVLLDQGKHVKVVDFGLARAQGFQTVTLTGAVFGTPAYLPPEQALGAGFEPRSDQYSLGVMIYQLITGELPFQAEDPLSLVMLHLNEEPPRLPGAVGDVVLRMMAKKPEDRYPDLAACLAALEAAL